MLHRSVIFQGHKEKSQKRKRAAREEAALKKVVFGEDENRLVRVLKQLLLLQLRLWLQQQLQLERLCQRQRTIQQLPVGQLLQLLRRQTVFLALLELEQMQSQKPQLRKQMGLFGFCSQLLF